MMGNRILLLGGAALIAGLGVVSMLVLDRGETPGPPSSSDFSIANEPIQFAPTQAQREFQRMAVAADEIPECSAPRVPNTLSPKAYIRNSYAAILDILAMQRWQETGSCECYYGKFAWDDVVAAAPGFERTDGIKLRFDFLKLRAQADEMLAQRSKVCSD